MKAISTISARQGQHLAATQGYINGACGHTEAFSGVLEMFKGNYQSVVSDANGGMNTSRKVAESMGGRVDAAHQHYQNIDNSIEKSWKQGTGKLGGEPLPGWPQRAVNAGQVPLTKTAGLFKDKGKDGFFGDEDAKKDPVGALKDKLKRKRPNAPTVEKTANKQAQRTIDRRGTAAYNKAKADALRQGKSINNAKKIAKKAGKAERQAATAELEKNNQALKNAGALTDVVTNGKKVITDTGKVIGTIKNINDYNNYDGTGGDVNDAMKKLADS